MRGANERKALTAIPNAAGHLQTWSQWGKKGKRRHWKITSREGDIASCLSPGTSAGQHEVPRESSASGITAGLNAWWKEWLTWFFIRAMCLRWTLHSTVKCLLHNKQKRSLSSEFSLYNVRFQVFENAYRVSRRILEAMNGVYWNSAILFLKDKRRRLNGKNRNKKKNDHCKRE